jgi:hypothetical protein
MAWNLPGVPSATILDKARIASHPPRFLILGKCDDDEFDAAIAGAHRFVRVGDSPHLLFDAIESLRLEVKDGVVG